LQKIGVWDVKAATNRVSTPFWKRKYATSLANLNIYRRGKAKFSATKSAHFERISLQLSVPISNLRASIFDPCSQILEYRHGNAETGSGFRWKALSLLGDSRISRSETATHFKPNRFPFSLPALPGDLSTVAFSAMLSEGGSFRAKTYICRYRAATPCRAALPAPAHVP
jgi:hypothetical protein